MRIKTKELACILALVLATQGAAGKHLNLFCPWGARPTGFVFRENDASKVSLSVMCVKSAGSPRGEEDHYMEEERTELGQYASSIVHNSSWSAATEDPVMCPPGQAPESPQVHLCSILRGDFCELTSGYPSKNVLVQLPMDRGTGVNPCSEYLVDGERNVWMFAAGGVGAGLLLLVVLG